MSRSATSALPILPGSSASDRAESAAPVSVSSRSRSTSQPFESRRTIAKDDRTSSHGLSDPDTSTDAGEGSAGMHAREARQRTADSSSSEGLRLLNDNAPVSHVAPYIHDVSQICLCQPNPKIPRPRNAFILYRQHHQQSIISRHRGLSNPEISKIAGQLWQAEPEAVKNTWKAFADEEKTRHAQQYPDYRFQPRHKNKTSPTSTSGDGQRCQKCGGHSIASNTSPFTTLLPASERRAHLFGEDKAASPTQTGATGSNRKSQGAMLNSSGLSGSKDSRPSNTDNIPLTRRYPDGAIELAEPKRRRRETYGVIAPAVRSEIVRTTDLDVQQQVTAHNPYPSPRTAELRRGSVPTFTEASYSIQRGPFGHLVGSPLSAMPHSAAPVMGPPPARIASLPAKNGPHAYPATPTTASQPHYLQYARAARARGNSETWRLAPLLSPAAGEHSRSIEAMIMSIPVVGKLGQLRRIAPPIKEPPIDSRPYPVRGSIIAVEADDRTIAETTLCQLESVLSRNNEFNIQVMPGPRRPKQHCTLKDYIDVVSQWHDETKRMVDFVTGVDRPRAEQSRAAEQALGGGRTPEELPRTNTTTENAANSDMRGDRSQSREHETANGTKQRSCGGEARTDGYDGKVGAGQDEGYPRSAAHEHAAKIPLLLIPNYILHGSNAWSSALPIHDVYSPADHWAWTATLWRGVVGADMTVYIRTMDRERDEPVSAGGTVLASIEKKVEVKDDVGAILVKSEDGRIGDGAVRRVAFEIGEWVRTQAGKQL